MTLPAATIQYSKGNTKRSTGFGVVETTTTTWDKFKKGVSQFKIGEKAGSFVVGGTFKTGERSSANMINRTMLTIDIDSGVNLADIEFALTVYANDFKFIAVSTASHTTAQPRVRVFVPLLEPVTPNKLAAMTKAFVQIMDLPCVDECSYRAAQLMFITRIKDADAPTWKLDNDVERMFDEFDAFNQLGFEFDDLVNASAIDKDAILVDDNALSDSDGIALMSIGSYPPGAIDNTLHTLKTVGADGAGNNDRDLWIRVGMGLHAQYAGTQEGLTLWEDWSASSDKYKEGECLSKWHSFKLGGALTFASLVKEAKDLRKEVKEDHRQCLLEEGDTSGMHSSFLDGWIWLAESERFYNVLSGTRLSVKGFNGLYASEPGLGEVAPAAYALSIPEFKRVSGEAYYPGKPNIFSTIPKGSTDPDINKYRKLNTWIQPDIKPCSVENLNIAAVTMAEEHFALLLPNDTERRQIIDFLAFIVQNPGERVNHCPVIIGTPGCGKTWIAQMMQKVLGERNVNTISTTEIVSGWTNWAVGSQLAVIEEIKMTGQHKYEASHVMKQYITNTRISINQKQKDCREELNTQSYLAFSNDPDCVVMDNDDRRYAPYYARFQTREELDLAFGGKENVSEYFKRLFALLNNDDDIASISYWLQNWELSDAFNAKGQAPITEARQTMIALNTSDNQDKMEDWLQMYACSIVNSEWIDITALGEMVVNGGEEFPKTNALKHILSKLGYMPMGSKHRVQRKGIKSRYIWKTKACELSFEEIKRIILSTLDDEEF